MNRSRYSGPPQGNSAPAYGSQDARNTSNLAVQPATDKPQIRLKKAAVKIVGAASPPVTRSPAPGPSSSPSPGPAAGPVHASPKQTDGLEVKALPFIQIPPSLHSQNDQADLRSEAETDLELMFARLTASSPRSLPLDPEPELIFTLDPHLDVPDQEKPGLDALSTECVCSSATPSVVSEKKTEIEKPKKKEPTKDGHATKTGTKDDLEREYLTKAREYIAALPTTKDTDADIIKSVAIKLRRPFAAPISLQLAPEQVAKLKLQYVEAIVGYINDVLKKSTPLSPSVVEQLLKDNDGDFLRLYAGLVDQKYLTLGNLEEVAGMCKAIMKVMPKEEIAKAPVSPVKTASPEPMDQMSSWPTQEKRENPAEHRTCILKGVSNFKTINQLQSIVWGGRLEAISMPEPGSNFATVRFLTAEGCQKYFDATQNGVEVPGNTKLVVFVEPAAGPNSTNDVIRNCAEGDTTRCVRAVDADNDWSDSILLSLARGQKKREVDTIKRGKTARGRYYIEFRFANIYHALNFKHQLHEDEDWEHCTIGYAPDPCEVANGVHFPENNKSGSLA